MVMQVRYVDLDRPDDSGDGLSQATAWKNPWYAATQVSTQTIIYVKSNTYTEGNGTDPCILPLHTAGVWTGRIWWVGYHTTPGDGGLVVFDAGPNTLANCVKMDTSAIIMNSFANFIFKNATDIGFNGNNADYTQLFRCGFLNNGGLGCWIDHYCEVLECLISGNGSHGLNMGRYGFVSDTIIKNNAGYGINGYGGTFLNTRIYGNTGYAFNLHGYLFFVSGCVIDANGNIGFRFSQNTHYFPGGFQNNILCHASIGIEHILQTVINEAGHIRNNLYYNNTVDVSNIPPVADQPGSIIATTDPFVDRDNGIYKLKPTSAVRGAGVDVGYTESIWDQYNAGVNPPSVITAGKNSFMDIGAQQARPLRVGTGGLI